jgi:hypothetical protein
MRAGSEALNVMCKRESLKKTSRRAARDDTSAKSSPRTAPRKDMRNPSENLPDPTRRKLLLEAYSALSVVPGPIRDAFLAGK